MIASLNTDYAANAEYAKDQMLEHFEIDIRDWANQNPDHHNKMYTMIGLGIRLNVSSKLRDVAADVKFFKNICNMDVTSDEVKFM